MAGQQAMGVASYFSASSTPNSYVTRNPSIAFTPQTIQFQATTTTTKLSYLAQILEHDLPNHEQNAPTSVTIVEDSEGDDDSGSEGQSWTIKAPITGEGGGQGCTTY